ncbi:MAG: phospholipase D-like domain-containing protein [Nocardioides sp.]
MTTSLRRALSLALALPLLTLSIAVGTSGAARATPDHFNPHRGATFNNPYGGRVAAHRIVTKLVRTINSVKKGHKIRIASWNFRSPAIAGALIRAHHRGVSVRVLMDYGNANPDSPNAVARHTQDELAQGNKHRPHDMTSWLHKCHGSCRGKHGIAHVKFYTFDKVEDTKDVVMYGSVNATELAATIQWNDMYTLTKSKSRYNEFIHVFNQMRLDHAVKQGYLDYPRKNLDIAFYPYTGEHTKVDPVLKVLNRVRCSGAAPGTGINGHTKIRIAQTATYGERGLAIAHRLVQMHERGCNIRVVYAMFGSRALHVLRHTSPTPVPLTHLAYDSNCDGIYDKYVHMKSMVISGVYGKDHAARIVWNGSANWTPVSLASDEVVGVVHRAGAARVYSNWIDYLFTHVPKAWLPGHCSQPGGPPERTADGKRIDPYALIRQDL